MEYLLEVLGWDLKKTWSKSEEVLVNSTAAEHLKWPVVVELMERLMWSWNRAEAPYGTSDCDFHMHGEYGKMGCQASEARKMRDFTAGKPNVTPLYREGGEDPAW